MKSLLLVFQLVTALALIGAILLHSAKGEGLGSIGGQARLFGSQKGLEQGLDRITAGCAIAFMSVSILLAIVGA